VNRQRPFSTPLLRNGKARRFDIRADYRKPGFGKVRRIPSGAAAEVQDEAFAARSKQLYGPLGAERRGRRHHPPVFQEILFPSAHGFSCVPETGIHHPF
jgi:hypothetical protein